MIFFILIPIVIFILILIHYHKKYQHSYLTFDQFKEHFIHAHGSEEDKDKSIDVLEMFTPFEGPDPSHIESERDFSSLHDYIHEFLCRPNENLNRPGTVCPFVPRSLKQRSFYFFISSNQLIKNSDDLIRTIRICRYDFLHKIEPKSGPKEKLIHKCLVITIQTPTLSHQTIAKVHKILKPEFILQYGLMLGEFFYSTNVGSSRNTNFYPFRTRVPLLVMRYMVASDLCFLNQQQYPVDIRLKMIGKYLQLYHAGLLYRATEKDLIHANDLIEELKTSAE